MLCLHQCCQRHEKIVNLKISLQVAFRIGSEAREKKKQGNILGYFGFSKLCSIFYFSYLYIHRGNRGGKGMYLPAGIPLHITKIPRSEQSVSFLSCLEEETAIFSSSVTSLLRAVRAGGIVTEMLFDLSAIRMMATVLPIY